MVTHLTYDIAEVKLETVSEELSMAIANNSDTVLYHKFVAAALKELKQMLELAENDKDPKIVEFLNSFIALVKTPTKLTDADVTNIDYLCDQISFRLMI